MLADANQRLIGDAVASVHLDLRLGADEVLGIAQTGSLEAVDDGQGLVVVHDVVNLGEVHGLEGAGVVVVGALGLGQCGALDEGHAQPLTHAAGQGNLLVGVRGELGTGDLEDLRVIVRGAQHNVGCALGLDQLGAGIDRIGFRVINGGGRGGGSALVDEAGNAGDLAALAALLDGEGQVLLTYKRLAAEKGSKRLEEAFENKEVLTAKVSQVLDGGLCVVVDETRVFIPASLVSDSYEKDLSKYKDQEIQFVISEFNPKRRRIIGDRKQLLVEKKLEQQKELFAKIKVGDVMEGTVKNVTDFGAFIDLGGADGLLHISEMSWGRVESPKKVFNVGDTVKVFIKDINDTKIALSMKFPSENPWNGAAEKFAVGNIVKGKVARMTDFGAFVELAPGVDALLHVSQISKDHVEKPADVLKIGQEIEAKVVDFNEDDKKISLSIKALEAPEEDAVEAAEVHTEE